MTNPTAAAAGPSQVPRQHLIACVLRPKARPWCPSRHKMCLGRSCFGYSFWLLLWGWVVLAVRLFHCFSCSVLADGIRCASIRNQMAVMVA